jgi:hypothetical protein
MYWDSFTAAGVFVSFVLILCAFYLELRKRPTVHHDDPRQTWSR